MQFALLPLLARHTPLVVLDFSGLTFLASLAMGVLVTFRRDMARWGFSKLSLERGHHVRALGA
jgi:anti-anti-sigma regulatory factor